MSTVPDKEQGCPNTSENTTKTDPISDELCEQNFEKKRKKSRNVSFPDDGELVTQYFEPANPWQHGEFHCYRSWPVTKNVFSIAPLLYLNVIHVSGSFKNQELSSFLSISYLT